MVREPRESHGQSRLRSWDLAAVAVLALAAALVAHLAPPSPIRALLGIGLALLAPGYALVEAIFPARGAGVAKGGVERAAIALGLGVATLPLVTLALNYTESGVTPATVSGALLGVTLFALFVALKRRERLPPESRRGVALALHGWAPRRGARAVPIALALATLATGTAIAVVLASPPAEEGFTVFEASDLAGRVDGIPARLAVGKSGYVLLSVQNREHAHAAYLVRMVAENGTFRGGSLGAPFDRGNATEVATWSISLKHEETWRRAVAFPADAPGDYRLRFFLEKSGIEGPYRELSVWVRVYPANATIPVEPVTPTPPTGSPTRPTPEPDPSSGSNVRVSSASGETGTIHAKVGADARFTARVESGEFARTSFRVQLFVERWGPAPDGEGLARESRTRGQTWTVDLSPGDAWSEPFAFHPSEAGTYRLELVLSIAGETTPVSTSAIWVEAGA